MTTITTIVLALILVVANAGADGVGFQDMVVEVEGEEVTHAIWYPTSVSSGRTTVGPFTMSATRDAPLGAGEYGLLLISHGTGGGRFNHRGTAIRLSETGYIVAAPEHAGDSWGDGRYSGTSAACCPTSRTGEWVRSWRSHRSVQCSATKPSLGSRRPCKSIASKEIGCCGDRSTRTES